MEHISSRDLLFKYMEQLANDPKANRLYKYVIDLMSEQAVSDFFCDLAVICRKTPAPCPTCGHEFIELIKTEHWFAFCPACKMSGAQNSIKDSAVNHWNRLAIPTAYRRITMTADPLTDQSGLPMP